MAAILYITKQLTALAMIAGGAWLAIHSQACMGWGLVVLGVLSACGEVTIKRERA